VGATTGAIVRRLWRSLLTAPDAAGWGFCTITATVAVIVLAGVGLAGGLFRLAQAVLPPRLVSTLFIPALGEELVFRGLLVPSRSEQPHPWIVLLWVTVGFTLWHGLETLFLHHAAAVFLRPDFLICAATLGLACGLMRWRTGSLWPGVLLHWAMVVVWQTWLGGPGLQALR
jgi:predicted Abi (CAAX) family protease